MKFAPLVLALFLASASAAWAQSATPNPNPPTADPHAAEPLVAPSEEVDDHEHEPASARESYERNADGPIIERDRLPRCPSPDPRCPTGEPDGAPPSTRPPRPPV